MMHHRRFLILLIFMGVVGACVFVLILDFVNSGKPVYIDAKAVRPWGKEFYNRCVIPRYLPSFDPEQFSKSLDTEITSDSITVRRTFGFRNINPPPVQITRLPLNGGQIDKDKSIYVKYIGAALLKKGCKTGETVRETLKFYYPDGYVVPQKEIREVFQYEHQRDTRFFSSNTIRLVWFYLDISGFKKAEIKDSILFDTNMKTCITRGDRHISVQNLHGIRHRVEILHNPEVQLLVDIASGSTENVEIMPDSESEKITFSNTACRITCFKFKNEKVLFLSKAPDKHYKQFGLKLITDEGKEISLNCKDWTNHSMMWFTDVSPEKIRIIKISYKPHMQRFLIPVNALPVTLEKNRNIENLLAITIPYKRFENDHEMLFFIEYLLQIDIEYYGKPKSLKKFFPREYQNAKAGEILSDYISMFPTKEVEYNEKEFILTLKDKKGLKAKIKEYLQRKLPFIP